jgi:hypothetical protein
MSQTVRKARRTLKLKVNASAPDAGATSDQAGATGNAEMPGDEALPAQTSAPSEIEPQLITAGDIRPNPNTTVATIVGLVEAKGTVSRSELVGAMGAATFMHRKARPQDQGWCQGYIAGAIRGGFLKIIDPESTAPMAAN